LPSFSIIEVNILVGQGAVLDPPPLGFRTPQDHVNENVHPDNNQDHPNREWTARSRREVSRVSYKGRPPDNPINCQHHSTKGKIKDNWRDGNRQITAPKPTKHISCIKQDHFLLPVLNGPGPCNNKTGQHTASHACRCPGK